MNYPAIKNKSMCLLFIGSLLAGALPGKALSASGNGLMAVAANTQGKFFSRYVYDPAVSYAGNHVADVLYFHNPGNPTWRAVSKFRLNSIRCRSALESFRKTGTWEGHLKPDGSCGAEAEPVEWAVGNWLNFESTKNR